MKLCKDCKHYNESGRCDHPKNFKPSLITGEKERIGFKYADRQRKQSWLDALVFGGCGKRGRRFEPKVEK